MYINAWRIITTEPPVSNHLTVCNVTLLVVPVVFLASGLFVLGFRLVQYGLSDHTAAKHRWFYCSKIQVDEVLLFKQFGSDTALPGRLTFHTAFVVPTARPDALERQSIECRALQFFPGFVPNTCPALPFVATKRLRLPCRDAWVDRHHEFLVRPCMNMAHDHLSQQGRHAYNCADDRAGCRQPPRFQNIQFREEGEGCVFVEEGRLGVGTSCTAEADGVCKPGCGSEQPRGVFAFTVAVCYWWLARVSVCLVGSPTEHLSRLGRVSFFMQRVLHVRNGTRDGIPGLLYRPRI